MSHSNKRVLEWDALDDEFADHLLDLAEEYLILISSQGECVSQNAAKIFYDERYANQAIKTYCKPCPVRRECLHYAIIMNEQAGTWGGFGERDRDNITLAARNEMRQEHPNDRFLVPSINNEYMWTKTVEFFDICAESPHKLFRSRGIPVTLKKKKEPNPLVQ